MKGVRKKRGEERKELNVSRKFGTKKERTKEIQEKQE